MLTFHGDQAIKKKYLDRVRAHEAADEIVKGKYWEDGRGCAVGCTIHGADHTAYEGELGISRQIAWLEDAIFEALPLAQATKWPTRFLRAIPIGVDVSNVLPGFICWLLMDPEEGMVRFDNDESRSAIYSVAALYALRLSGKESIGEVWRAAEQRAALLVAALRHKAWVATTDSLLLAIQAAQTAAWAVRLAQPREGNRWGAWAAWQMISACHSPTTAELITKKQANKLLELLRATGN